MEDFIMRTVTEEALGYSVSRMRNSNGTDNITISRENNEIVIVFNYTAETNTSRALVLADLITKIANNPCKLPEVKE